MEEKYIKYYKINQLGSSLISSSQFTLKEIIKTHINNLIKKLNSCSIRSEENFGDTFSNVFIKNPQYNDYSKRYAALKWSEGHTIANHLFTNLTTNIIPGRLLDHKRKDFPRGKQKVVGVWYDEQKATDYIVNALTNKIDDIVDYFESELIKYPSTRLDYEFTMTPIDYTDFIHAISVFEVISPTIVRHYTEQFYQDYNNKVKMGNTKNITSSLNGNYAITVRLKYSIVQPNITESKLHLITAFPILS